MDLSEFIELAQDHLSDFKHTHENCQAAEGVSLYPEAMSEDEWWESFDKYRSNLEDCR